VFFGSALWNFGVRQILDAVVDLAPSPTERKTTDGVPRPIDAPFSGFIFKVQANMDPLHRDRMAFVRVCSGVFERGMPVVHGPTGRQLTTRHLHQLFGRERATVEAGYPGDVIGLVTTAQLGVGDTIYAERPVAYPPIPRFVPEHFARVRNRDTSRYKRFRVGIEQLDQEGVVQILRHADLGDQAPVFAACGPLQFDVARHRMENEFGAQIELTPMPHRFARRTDSASGKRLVRERDVEVLERSDGVLVALFANPHQLARLEREDDDLVLEPLDLGGG